MYRIDKIFAPPSVVGHSDNNDASALYVCISTAINGPLQESNITENTGGINLLTVGRKNCDINFENDKSVSRRHCRLRIMADPAQCRNDESNEQDCVYAAKTDEEIAACQSSDCGVVILAEDMGSKFGTFVVEKKKPGTDTNKNKAKGDNSDTDVTTDDEAPQHSSLPPSSFSQGIDGTEFDARKLEPKDAYVLKSLSHIRSDNTAIDQEGCNSIIVRVGVSGSAIRITRLNLVLCCSRCDKSVLSNMIARSHLIGAKILTSWDSKRCSHLICPQRLGTAKVFAAWASRLPIVHPSFFEALLERKSDDLFPDEHKYAPPGECITDNLDQDAPRDIFRNCHFISLVEDEIENLVRAAGGLIFEAHAMDDETFFDSEWINEWKENTETEKRGKKRSSSVISPLGFIESVLSKRKQKKRMQFLLKNGVTPIGQKEVASSITQLKPLKEQNQPEDTNENMRRDSGTVQSEEKPSPPVETRDESFQSEKSTHDEESRKEKTTKKNVNQINEQTSSVTSDRVDHFENMKLATIVEKAKDTSEDMIEGTEQFPRPDQAEPDKICSPSQHATTESNNFPGASDVDDSVTKTRKRKRLLEKPNGWMVSAPSNDRSAYRTMINTDENNNSFSTTLESAQTEKRGNLVVRSKQDILNIRQQQSFRHPRNNSSSGPNFKRFKKNRIICARARSLSRSIKLRSVLPKESQKQIQLQLTQQELDRTQREADLLFADRLGGGGLGSHGIKRFFSKSQSSSSRPTAVKRKRR